MFCEDSYKLLPNHMVHLLNLISSLKCSQLAASTKSSFSPQSLLHCSDKVSRVNNDTCTVLGATWLEDVSEVVTYQVKHSVMTLAWPQHSLN